MKVGYSFESLVRKVLAVDDSAVHITGNETVDGLKTFVVCPATTAAQGGSGGHLTRRDFVTTELAKKFDKTGGDISGAITAAGTIKAAAFEATTATSPIRTGKSGTDEIQGVISSESTYVMLWRRHKQVATKSPEFIGIDGNSRLIFRKDNGTGDAKYRDLHVYYPGNEPTASAVGAIPASMLPSGTSWDDNFKSKVATFTSGGSLELGYIVDMRAQFSMIDYDVRFQISEGSETTSGQGTLNIFGKSFNFGLPGGQKLSFRSGITTSDKFIIGIAQGSESGAATRKDYVDTELAKKLNSTGGTLTGNLVISTGVDATLRLDAGTDVASAYLTFSTKGVNRFRNRMNGNGTQWLVERYDDTGTSGETVLSLARSTGEFTFLNCPLVTASQSAANNALTRRDFVTTELSKKLDLTGGALTGGVTITSSSNPLIIRSSTEGISQSLRFLAQDSKGTERWYIGQGVSNNGDMYIRNQTQDTTITLGASRVEFNKPIYMNAAQSTLGPSATRKDYVDGQIATRAPSSHNHTAAEAMRDIITSGVGGGYNNIGITALLLNVKYNNGIVYPGQHLAGTDLVYTNAAGEDIGAIPSGTWKCLGFSQPANYGNPMGKVALYIKVG